MKKNKKIAVQRVKLSLQTKLISFSIIFLLTFIIFSLTSSRFALSEYGDSGELITAAYTMGIPHAPSYPLYMLLGNIVTHLPLSTPAHMLNIFSGFLNALALSFLYLSTIEILEEIFNKHIKKDGVIYRVLLNMAAIGGILSVAFSFFFFLYSNISEVFALNNFLIALIIFLTLKFRDTWNKDSKKALLYFYILCTSAGLMLSNQQTSILILPPTILVLIITFFENKEKRKLSTFLMLSFTGIILSVAFFFIPYIYLIFASKSGSIVSWGNVKNFGDIMNLILRKDYGSGSALASYNTGLPIQRQLSELFPFTGFIKDHFSILGLIIALFGFFKLIQNQEKFNIKRYFLDNDLGIYILLLFILSGPFLAGYTSIPWSDSKDSAFFSTVAVHLRMYLQSEALLSIPISVGILYLLKIIEDNFKDINLKYFFVIILLITFTLPLFLFVTNIYGADKSSNNIMDRFAKDTLNSLPQKSIIISFADETSFSLFYAQNVEGIRKDVTIITLIANKNRPQLLKKDPGLFKTNSTYTLDILKDTVALNYGKRKIYILFASLQYLDQMGLHQNPYYLIPYGYALEVRSDPSGYTQDEFNKSREIRLKIDSIVKDIAPDRRDFSYVSDGIGFATAESLAGYLYNQANYPQYAIQTYEDVKNSPESNVEDISRLENEAKNNNLKIDKYPTYTDYFGQGKSYFDQGQYVKALDYFESAHLLNFDSDEVAKYMSICYKKIGEINYYNWIKQEYPNI